MAIPKFTLEYLASRLELYGFPVRSNIVCGISNASTTTKRKKEKSTATKIVLKPYIKELICSMYIHMN